jgi:hypothetical protein
MSYESALVAAGAEVIDTKYTGSYQGTWGSIVVYNGVKGLCTGDYGSCSGCDAFQAEFDSYQYGEQQVGLDEETGKYYRGWSYYGDNEISKEEYDKYNKDYQNRLAEFGRDYLNHIYDKWDVQNRLDQYAKKDENDWFDEEEKELYSWAITYL